MSQLTGRAVGAVLVDPLDPRDDFGSARHHHDGDINLAGAAWGSRSSKDRNRQAQRHRSSTAIPRTLQVIGGQVPAETVALQWKLPPAPRARPSRPSAGRAGGLLVGLQIMGPLSRGCDTIDIARLMSDVVGGFEVPPGYA